MAYSPNVDYRAVARNKARKYGLDPNIFERQIGVESIGYSPSVISGQQHSPAGAVGIAQFMPGTAAGLGVDPTRPVKALDAAARLMAGYVRKYGSYRNALVAYNAGPGAVGRSQLPSETVNYVQQILRGHDPGRLGPPVVSQRRPIATTATPSAPASSVSSSGLNAPGIDPSLIASLLQPQPQQQVQATLPAMPSFSGAKYLSTGMALPAAQTPATDSSLQSKLQAISSLVPQADIATATTTTTGTLGGKPQRQGVGRTLVVGDSLGVGTLPTLKSLLGGKVTGNALVGRSSDRGVRVLKNLLRSGNYQNVVFDLGTNDASAGQLARSLHEAIDLAPNTTFYVPTLNGPGAAQKNDVLHRIAAANPNVKLVAWHSASQGMQLAQGIHPDGTGYQRRGDLLAQALGYQPQRAGSSRQPGGLVAPSAAWNPAGDRMRPWLAQALAWAHQNGWGGAVISGYRTAAEQDAAARRYGLSHYGRGGPQASNHRTGNAVDVTDPQGLAAVLRRYPGRRPIWAGPTIGDPSHFSIDGH